MVTRTRLRSILTALGLQIGAALLIGYFAIHAYSGERGLRARIDLNSQMRELRVELEAVKRDRARWETRVSLLRSANLDPDMLDERARALLDFVHPRELTFIVGR